jgi:hypothetical protein
MIKVDLELGIITQEEKEILECYVDSRLIVQRKSYPEYYVQVDKIGYDVDLNDLQILSQVFTVTVHYDSITISHKY